MPYGVFFGLDGRPLRRVPYAFRFFFGGDVFVCLGIVEYPSWFSLSFSGTAYTVCATAGHWTVSLSTLSVHCGRAARSTSYSPGSLGDYSRPSAPAPATPAGNEPGLGRGLISFRAPRPAKKAGDFAIACNPAAETGSPENVARVPRRPTIRRNQ